MRKKHILDDWCVSCTCADPESFVREGPTLLWLFSFFFFVVFFLVDDGWAGDPYTQWFIYNFGLMSPAVLGLSVSHFNESNCITLFLMLLHPGTRWNKKKNFVSQRQNYAQKMQDAQVTKSLYNTKSGPSKRHLNGVSLAYRCLSDNEALWFSRGSRRVLLKELYFCNVQGGWECRPEPPLDPRMLHIDCEEKNGFPERKFNCRNMNFAERCFCIKNKKQI